MLKLQYKFLPLAYLLLALMCYPTFADKLNVSFPNQTARYWLAPNLWANRMQDWRIMNGRAECTNAELPLRTVHLITAELNTTGNEFNIEMEAGYFNNEMAGMDDAFIGFMIGCGHTDLHYKARAYIQTGSGKNGGVLAVVNGKGKTVILDNEDSQKILSEDHAYKGSSVMQKSIISLKALKNTSGTFNITICVSEPATGRVISQTTLQNMAEYRLRGGIAVVVNGKTGTNTTAFWWTNLSASGTRLSVYPERSFGPVWSAMHTLSKGTFKLTAQFPPLGESDSPNAILQLKEGDKSEWKTVSTAKIMFPGWYANFKILHWDDTKNYAYRIGYQLKSNNGVDSLYFYEGNIRKNPMDKAEIKVAAISCSNHNMALVKKQMDFTTDNIWFPHQEITVGVNKRNPDIILHLGDQFYEGNPTNCDKSGKFTSYIDYLYHWSMWCWAYGELSKNIPTLMLVDDHDVYQINIWGEEGAENPWPPLMWNDIAPQNYKGNWWQYETDGGGYTLPAGWINMVQRTMTSHLPDPVDPAPVKQDIEVYFTDFLYGGISFALVEDRKFKTAPSPRFPQAKIVDGRPANISFNVCDSANVPDAKLLGDRQLAFLENWVQDWNKTDMKCLLSQTIFTNLSTSNGKTGNKDNMKEIIGLKPGLIPNKDHILLPDFDSNSWPQHERNKTLEIVRKAEAFMIGGDQHLASIVKHGIEQFDDAGYSFCVPATSNIAPRRWFPPMPGSDRNPDLPPYTGKYNDAFCNKITVIAAANPYDSQRVPKILHDRATGYGMIHFNKKKNEISMHCYPRFTADTSDTEFIGFPLTIQNADNDGRIPLGDFGEIKIKGLTTFPVVKLIDEQSKEVIYVKKVPSYTLKPVYFAHGTYTLWVGNPDTNQWKILKGLRTNKKINQSLQF